MNVVERSVPTVRLAEIMPHYVLPLSKKQPKIFQSWVVAGQHRGELTGVELLKMKCGAPSAF